MNLIITGGRVVSDKVIRDGAVVVEENRIVDIGRSDDLRPKYRRYEKIDAKRHLVIPGLINSHTHAAMTLFRGYADDLHLKEWLENRIWPIEATLTADEIELGARLAAVECLLSGTTTLCSVYHYVPDRNEASAFAEAGIRAVVGHGCFSWRKEQDRKMTFDLARKWHGSNGGRIRVSVAPHAPYTVDPQYFRELEDIRRDLNEKFGQEHPIIHCTHVAETKGEVEEVRKAFGVEIPGGSLFSYLDELDVLSDQFLAAHCVYPTKTDMEIMRKRGVKASHNIVSNFKLGSGLSPVSDMIKQGITVSLGTDSPASNNSLDMFETLKYVTLAQKFGSGDPTALPASQAFRLATIEGGKALCWEDLGWLRPGFLADIVTIRLRKPHLTPLYDEYSQLVYAVKSSDVSTVVVDGELVVDNGRLIPLDVESLLDVMSGKALELQERASDVTAGARP